MDQRPLFTPYSLKSLSVKNRFVMAPMTRAFSPGGVPTADVAAYYRRRAEGEVGLILSEGTVIDRPASANHPDIPNFHGDEALSGWKRVIDDVHQAGGKMGPQIWHMGAVTPNPKSTLTVEDMEGPSGLLGTGEAKGRAMTDEDVADAIEAYAKSAAYAEELGFDMVEIHGAHGYLIDQFFWGITNLRADTYGGDSIKSRVRFGVEVVEAVRRAVSPDFVVCLRLSQWKLSAYETKLASTPTEMEEWLAPLSEAGVDLFHCSQRRFWEPEFDGSDLNFAGWAKKLTGKPTITVGSVGLTGEVTASFQGEASKPESLGELERRFERGDFDLVAVGRVLISDPQWVRKLREGREEDFIGFDSSSYGTLI